MSDADRELVNLILSAYARGGFPMGNEKVGPLGVDGAFGHSVDWFRVDPRSIVPLRGTERGGDEPPRFARSLRAKVRSCRFEITTDAAFERVMRACAAVPRREASGETWINAWMIDAYTKLHDAGHAHSVEAWLKDDAGTRVLVGGLYGVHLGAAFFGESMFSRPDLGGTDASKVCFVHLVAHLRERGFELLDSQYTNPHMQSLGTVEISAKTYGRRLAAAIAVPIEWQPFDAAAGVRLVSRT